MGRVIVLIRYFKDFTIARKKHIRKKISKNGSLSLNKSKFKEISVIEVFQKFVKSNNTQIFLKIDIEGSEYEIIEQIMIYHKQIRIIVIEFHDIIERKKEFKTCLEKLKKYYFLIHSHANNYSFTDDLGIPNVCEFTFVKRSSYKLSKKVKKLPILELDAPCSPLRPEIQMIFK